MEEAGGRGNFYKCFNTPSTLSGLDDLSVDFWFDRKKLQSGLILFPVRLGLRLVPRVGLTQYKTVL